MSIDIVMGEPEEEPYTAQAENVAVDPDEFFAKNAFRIVYQTNNFFLPQIRDLIDKGEVLNLHLRRNTNVDCVGLPFRKANLSNPYF